MGVHVRLQPGRSLCYEQADWYATVAKQAGVDAHDIVQIGGGSHDIDVRRSLVSCVRNPLRL